MSRVTPTARLPVFGLLLATGMSVGGNAIVQVAIPWFVLERTGSASLAGMIGAISLAPLVISSLAGGALVDRIGRRRSSIIADLLSAAAVVALPVLDATVGANLVLVGALVALGAVFDGPGMAAREALRPGVARRSGLSLERVNSSTEAADGLGALVGPGLGGLLIASVGPLNALWATSAMFLIAVISTAAVVPSDSADRDQRVSGRYWREVVTGLRFVWHERSVRDATLIATILVVFVVPFESVLLQSYLQRSGQATALGVILTSFAAGGVIGSLLYGQLAHRLRRATVLRSTLALATAAFAGFALLPPPLWMAGLGLAAGVAVGPINPICAVVLQERTPERMRGQVIGSFASLALAAGPAGILFAGLLVDAAGSAAAFGVVSVGCLLTALFAARVTRNDALEPRAERDQAASQRERRPNG